jgi:hypothetical protein
VNIKVMIRVFQIDIPITYLQTALVISIASFLIGGPVVTVLIGGSVDKAIAAKVSIIILIQSNCTGENGDSLNMIPPIITAKRQEIFTVT